MTTRRLAAFALVLVLAAAAPAEVRHTAEGGFTVASSTRVEAPVSRVWQTLTEEIAAWWHPDHTFSADAGNLSLDPRPGGCFCEALPEGGGVRHLEVVHVDRERLLRLSGGLGPLQGIGASGSLSWTLAPEEGATRLEVVYVVHGTTEGGLAGWAAPVDGVIAQQLERLARLVEKGDPGAD